MTTETKLTCTTIEKMVHSSIYTKALTYTIRTVSVVYYMIKKLACPCITQKLTFVILRNEVLAADYQVQFFLSTTYIQIFLTIHLMGVGSFTGNKLVAENIMFSDFYVGSKISCG